MIKNLFYSFTQHKEMIKVSHYPSLLSLGLELATIDGESKPLPAASNFVLAAVCNCVVRAQDILMQQGIAIGADMAHYWESGFDCCCWYHKLFFNGLLAVLYGGTRDDAEGILDSAKAFEAYHLERPYITASVNSRT